MLSTNATVAVNRRARYEYEILETFEAGIVLTGTEVKALRLGRANIAEAYAGFDRKGELCLFNGQIPHYPPAGAHLQHEPQRHRRLLLNRKELNRLTGALQRKGLTLVPLKLYFNHKGLAKLSLGLAEGKKVHDKRETEKQRDWQRQKQRILKERG